MQMDIAMDTFADLYDVDDWDKFFSADEMQTIKDYIEICVGQGRNDCAIRFLMEESNDSMFPYYIWIVIDFFNEEIDKIKVYIPKSINSLLDCPDGVEKYLRLERAWS